MEVLNGRKLRLLIAEHGYNVRSLGRATHIAEPTINNWLNGKSGRLDLMARVAKALNMSLADFIKATCNE